MAEEKQKRMTIIASKGSLDMAYPPVILASTAAAMDVETMIFFTFYGIDIINKHKYAKLQVAPIANPAMPSPVPMPNIIGMLPGMSNLKGFSVDEKQLKRIEAMVLSMTNQERERPNILNARRRKRIARGSGTTVTEVNDLLQRFGQMRKMMKNMGKLKKKMMSAPSGGFGF